MVYAILSSDAPNTSALLNCRTIPSIRDASFTSMFLSALFCLAASQVTSHDSNVARKGHKDITAPKTAVLPPQTTSFATKVPQNVKIGGTNQKDSARFARSIVLYPIFILVALSVITMVS